MIPLILIIISDRAASGERPDETIPQVTSWLSGQPYELIEDFVVADNRREIEQAINASLAHRETALIVTSGGTGFAGRDITPEVTRTFILKPTPGIDEYLRAEGRKKTPFAVLSRGISGINGNKMIVNLPGNPKAVIENLGWLAKILPHAMKVLDGPVADSEHKVKRN
jgi:molybdopterin adenylyltransferase